MARSGKGARQQSRLRIIGGQWRGRKLAFSPEQGLRPTTDRIRETLFNWLAPHIHGARCADLFAGSGALGLEALSRGAAHCDFVEPSASALDQIRKHLQSLDALGRANCHRVTAEQFLTLAGRRLLSPGALVYVETAANEDTPEVADNWSEHRGKTSGGVTYRLYAVG
jgi:16S rRNA (guanine966-N2)-methyltransferase